MQNHVQYITEGIPALPEMAEALPPVIVPPQQNFGPSQMRPGDGIPQFEAVPVKLPTGEYVTMEYVTILTPGDPKASPRRKVNDALRQKYAAYYDHWRRGLEMSPHGVPLEMWPAVTPSQVHALKALNIFTVEQLAEIADSHLHRIPMGATMKLNAQKWLKTKKDTDEIERQTHENQILKDGQNQLQQQLAALTARLDTAENEAAEAKAALAEKNAEPEPTKRGPGRPPKS